MHKNQKYFFLFSNADLVCYSPGQCQGELLDDTTSAGGAEGCLDLCRADPRCKWFNYNMARTNFPSFVTKLFYNNVCLK